MRALISLTDKSNLKYLGEEFQKLNIEIISTGGTLKKLEEYNISAKDISSITNFKEILGGRVKTLSPYVHGGILFRRDLDEDVSTIKEMNILPIDIVVVNLYDFARALKGGEHNNIIENIDIGGPTMIRAAAKNYKDVLVVTDLSDYEELISRLKENRVDLNYREYLASKAFSLTAYYDSMISRYFLNKTNIESKYFTLGLDFVQDLRYGENHSQKAKLYKDNFVESYFSDFEIVHGKEMSFNNYADLNPAIELASELGDMAVVGLKHQTPCAAALKSSVFESYKAMYEADSTSIFGGIVAINGVVDEKTAIMINEIFLEIVAAIDFTPEALKILTSKKNIRLLKIDFNKKVPNKEYKYLDGVVLEQQRDTKEDGYEIVTKKNPTEDEKKDLEFAMKVVKYVKSNGIVVAKNGVTLGIGTGQTSRIWALSAIKNNYDVDFTGASLASDAFFPFDDCVRMAYEMGIGSIIQPGGSIKDSLSIDACNELGISMAFTSVRHFRH